MALGTSNDASMHSGDTMTLEVTVNDSAGSPLDISAGAFTWVLSKKSTTAVEPRGAALVSKTLGSGVSFTNTGTDGLCEVLIDPADTAALAGVFYHEFQVTIAGVVSTVLFGSVTIAKDLA
jgi:hypothetical protein